MPRQRQLFGELLSDQAGFGSPGVVAADNVFPIANGYKPLGGFSASVDGTLPADCLGAASFRSSTGVTFTIAGGSSALYRYTTSSGWASVGSGYSATTLVGWRFRQFGDLIIAVNGADAPQKLDMTAGSPAFSALGGTPPNAELIAVVRDFTVFGRVGADNTKVRWSGINNCESWTIGTAQSDEQIMPTGGEVVAIAGGEYGLVLQETRVSRMSYVGGDAIFQFDELGTSIGCVAAGSVAQVGRMVFFMSHQGFAVCDGTSVRTVGDEKVNRTVLAEIDRTNLAQMSATVDPRNSLIIWAIPNGATPSKLYIYNYALDRWSTASQTVQRLFPGLTESVTLEDLDATYASIDAMTASLDDPQWKGGFAIVALIDGDRKLGTLSGQPKAATFTTPHLDLATPMRTRLRRVMPLVDTTTGLTLTVSGRNMLGETATETETTTLNRVGEFVARANYKYLQFSLAIDADTAWTYALGLEVEYEPGGR